MSDPERSVDTVAATINDSTGHEPVAIEVTLENLGFEQRYAPGEELGRGGMGEVIGVRDEQIGREIALKRVLGNRLVDASVRARFLREARVQGQLEHPAIVPVYDLGVDAAGDAWFTMKRVRGATLEDIIVRLRAGEAETTAKYSPRRLLTALSSVCLAMDYVHARGVIHRDLKPANVMLGDFGEVYVLDWGIARIAGLSDEGLGHTPSEQARAGSTGATTQAGEILGTVGYMAPEQLLGQVDAIGPATDVWALGAILFELLALEPLLLRSSLGEAVANADQDIDARPSVRTPGLTIAPELDSICQRATARKPDARYPSARRLHDAIERYLDGDRDLQRRRDQAAVHLERAQAAEARAASGGPAALGDRSHAMQEINRALALDPSSEDARHAMVRLLVEPPSTVPDEAQAEIGTSTLEAVRLACRVGGLGFLSMYLFLPFYLWMGIRDWGVTGAVLTLIAAASALCFWGVSSPHHGRWVVGGLVIVGGVLTALLTRVVGPFASAPILAFGLAIGIVLNPAGLGLRGVCAFVAIALVAPLVLELVGAVESSYVFRDDMIMVVPHMTELPPIATLVTLTMTSVGTILALGLYLAQLQRLLRTAQVRLHVYSWNLRQFLPASLPGARNLTP